MLNQDQSIAMLPEKVCNSVAQRAVDFAIDAKLSNQTSDEAIFDVESDNLKRHKCVENFGPDI